MVVARRRWKKLGEILIRLRACLGAQESQSPMAEDYEFHYFGKYGLARYHARLEGRGGEEEEEVVVYYGPE